MTIYATFDQGDTRLSSLTHPRDMTWTQEAARTVCPGCSHRPRPSSPGAEFLHVHGLCVDCFEALEVFDAA